MSRLRSCRLVFLSILVVLVLLAHSSNAALSPSSVLNYTVADSAGSWVVSLRPWKGSIAAIRPNASDAFSFINDDRAGNFSSIPYHHSHGDITLRVRTSSESSYRTYTTADSHLNHSAIQLDSPSSSLASFDVTPLLRTGSGLTLTKRFDVVTLPGLPASSALTLTLTVTNNASDTLVLGALGLSALFSSNWNDLDLRRAAEQCSLAEPSIAGDHGWVKVTRLTGEGRVLLMSPVPAHRQTSALHHWRQLKGEDATPAGYAFEGHYEWTAISDAWDADWHQPQPWTGGAGPIQLAVGESATFAWQYQLIPNVRALEPILLSQGEFSSLAVPGYLLSTDMTTARLYIAPPAGTSLYEVNLDGPGSLILQSMGSGPTPYLAYSMNAKTAGRVRVAFTFRTTTNTTSSTAWVNLFVSGPLDAAVSSIGSFSAAHQWYTNMSDPFGRAYSIMPYDFEAHTMTLQDDRSYVVGLSDEAGAGPGLAFAMANRYRPDAAQAELLDVYINRTLRGVKGGDGGPVPFAVSVQNANWSVRASMFWYDRPGMPGYHYTVRDGWDQDRSAQLWRSYNYVHPTVLYHTMYRVCRDFDQLPRLYSCQWYLTAAYQTFLSMFADAPYYTQFGLMEGSVFLDVMDDLALEGRDDESSNMRAMQEKRVDTWRRLPFPFGSEMPWDSTGQEEIWLSAQAFGQYELSNSSLSAILAYAHAVPNWAYHGSARRFWDFWINGKPNYTQSWPERNLHHYGSSLNGKPLLRAYETNPDDLYTLQVAIGAATGVLSNIQPGGATSMGFHADPALLKHDPFDADYGCALYGHVTSASSYLVMDPRFGASCYLCDVAVLGQARWEVVPKDSLQRRVYLEPIGASVEVEAGRIVTAVLDVQQRTLNVTLAPSAGFSVHRLKLQHWALCSIRPGCGLEVASPKVQLVRGAWTFPATAANAVVTVTWPASPSSPTSAELDTAHAEPRQTAAE